MVRSAGTALRRRPHVSSFARSSLGFIDLARSSDRNRSALKGIWLPRRFSVVLTSLLCFRIWRRLPRIMFASSSARCAIVIDISLGGNTLSDVGPTSRRRLSCCVPVFPLKTIFPQCSPSGCHTPSGRACGSWPAPPIRQSPPLSESWSRNGPTANLGREAGGGKHHHSMMLRDPRSGR